ncbi:hypothetical protein Z945_3116 [Sulfitobacter noctilucae]|nr:hypothetical protein Z945_3116 [Sulfitobacter noctilucae]
MPPAMHGNSQSNKDKVQFPPQDISLLRADIGQKHQSAM